MLDTDSLGVLLSHIDDEARLPVWLACKAFSALRPAGTFPTSVRAMYATPAMHVWAMGIGCPPPHRVSSRTALMALQMLCELDPVALATFGFVIAQLAIHPEEQVSSMADALSLRAAQDVYLSALTTSAAAEDVAMAVRARVALAGKDAIHAAERVSVALGDAVAARALTAFKVAVELETAAWVDVAAEATVATVARAVATSELAAWVRVEARALAEATAAPAATTELVAFKVAMEVESAIRMEFIVAWGAKCESSQATEAAWNANYWAQRRSGRSTFYRT